jgi:ankyrin repeat protein
MCEKALRDESTADDHLTSPAFLVGVNAADRVGSTALLLSVKRLYASLASKLVSLGADVNHTDDRRLTPLHYACRVSDEEDYGVRQQLIRLLLAHVGLFLVATR